MNAIVRRRWVSVAIVLVLCQRPAPGAEKADVQTLLEGVNEVVAPGCVPGPIAVFGEGAFTVMTGKSGAFRLPLFAAARFGKGRLFVAGHEGFFNHLDEADNLRLLKNGIAWTGGRPLARLRVGVVDDTPLADALRKHKIDAVALKTANATERETCDVLVANGRAFPRAGVKEVQTFVEQGGGLVLTGLGWGYLATHPGKDLSADYGGNQVLLPMGLALADGTLGATGPKGKGWIADGRGLGATTHAVSALGAIARQASGKARLSAAEVGQASVAIMTAAAVLPTSSPFFTERLQPLVNRYGGHAVPSPAHPIKATAVFDRFEAMLAWNEIERKPAARTQAHPAAATFPGPVPKSAARVTRTIDIDWSAPGWQSTGLYAAPGETITIDVPDAAAGKGLKVQIGCHTDRLWELDRWERFPEIVLSTPIAHAKTTLANPFGGLVYLETSRGSGRGNGSGRVPVQVAGAVEAPYFVRGVTSKSEWSDTIRARPAPWAELQGHRVIFTVPSNAIRKLDDPEALLALWDEAMDHVADLATIPHERPRPERYVPDQQISAGYMHSGYPIMVHLDQVDFEVDRQRVLKEGAWGHYHETGHNHQVAAWTFDGTTEVTCNLFSLYVCEKLNHITERPHPALDPKQMDERLRKYLADGAKFSAWQHDPFLALTMYMQLEEAFGWDAYKTVFAEYKRLPAAERPKTDDEKRDQWLTRFSRTVGKNLGPFFQAWGVPTSEAARASIKDLPVWMPAKLSSKVKRAVGSKPVFVGWAVPTLRKPRRKPLSPASA